MKDTTMILCIIVINWLPTLYSLPVRQQDAKANKDSLPEKRSTSLLEDLRNVESLGEMRVLRLLEDINSAKQYYRSLLVRNLALPEDVRTLLANLETIKQQLRERLDLLSDTDEAMTEDFTEFNNQHANLFTCPLCHW